MSIEVIKKGQCTVDFALQHYGSFTGVFDIARKNNTRLIDNLEPGAMLEVAEVSNQTVDYIKAKGVVIATTDDDLFQGIGAWIIEEDFKVS